MKTIRRFAVSIVVFVAAIAAFAATPTKKANYLEWGDTPEGYFMTTEERAEWEKVVSKEQADKFVEQYWARRGDDFRRDLQSRIAAADKYFGLSDRKGSTTEKGRVFILLGAPTREQTARTSGSGGGFGTSETGANSLERTAIVGTEWLYRTDRLPKELGVPELTVKFQTDVSRGFQTIENPGLIEPYLKRVSDLYSKKAIAAAAAASATRPPAQTPTEIKASIGGAPAAPNAIWSSTAALNGAYFTGESFVAVNEKPFYAYSFYLPQSMAALAGAKDVVLVGSIKDASGNEVANVRQPATPTSYDASGDRFADGSVELAPGKYTGAFGLYTSDGATLLASARTDFDVADPAATRVSRLLLTSHIDTFDKQGLLDPFTFVAMKYAVKGNSKFRKADAIGYFTFVANPTANPAPSMTMKMKVSKGGKVIETTPPLPADLMQTGPHTYLLATRFEPNSFTPGHYTIEVTLRDMNAPKDSDAYKKGYVSTTEFDVTQ